MRALGLLLIGVVVVALSVGLGSPKSPLSLAEPEAARPEGRVTLGGAPLRDYVPLTAGSSRLADGPVAALKPSDVRAMRSEGKQTVLVLKDGSELAVTPYVAAELPYELRLRVNYVR